VMVIVEDVGTLSEPDSGSGSGSQLHLRSGFAIPVRTKRRRCVLRWSKGSPPPPTPPLFAIRAGNGVKGGVEVGVGKASGVGGVCGCVGRGGMLP
jgi:hypothetical protein